MSEVAPLVSVVLPFYDNHETVREAVESVLNQTWTDLELVAIDDGSPDGSAEIVAEFAGSDDRVTLVRQANAGAAAARNVGLRAAQGRFCARIDADDLWLPTKLERQMPLLDDHTVVFSDAWAEQNGRRYPYGRILRRPRGKYPRGDVFEELLRQCFIPALTAVAPLELVRKLGGFDERFRIVDDWDLWLRLAIAGAGFDYVPEPLAVYRVRPGSLSSDVVQMHEENVQVLALQLQRVPPAKRGLVRRRVRAARAQLEASLRKRAWRSVLAGKTGAGRRDVVRSLRVRPYSPRAWLALALTLCPPLARRAVRERV